MDKYFPSKYTTPQDLVTSGEVILTMDRMVEESVNDLQHEGQKVAKPILYFTNGHKPVVVNKQIGLALVTMYGDPPQVSGKPLSLFAEQRRGKLSVTARCIVGGAIVQQASSANPSVPDMGELNAANAELARVKAELAAQQAKAAKGAKKGKR